MRVGRSSAWPCIGLKLVELTSALGAKRPLVVAAPAARDGAAGR
jgi:hypothetical protein